ncbi:hypothetical protein CPB83DRAFT_857477 [Crepidotus variabilis]|uniref:Uncharacterized protein n=1 Tax=Crepidotus variabilis TaxID=179855 RepID=A0A9P6JMR8_9AGAR|nr:hypothetical protein CPB83DRAFT_857477 [Crepidotus variabilis]
MANNASTFHNSSDETQHEQDLFFPPEIILLILQELEGRYATLLHLSLCCKLLHAEAQPLLYRSLHVRINYGISIPVVTGPPPKSYIDNPSLAKFIQIIAYLECIGTGSDKDMRKILSGSFAHYMPNLKTMSLAFECGIPKVFLSGDFQLEELSLSGEDYPYDLEAILRDQKQLQKLKMMTYQHTLPPLPLSICPKLHTLTADMLVAGAFLPLHNIHTLIWKSWYFDRPDCLDHHFTKGLNGLRRLCHSLAVDRPPLQELAKHLKNLQYLAQSIQHICATVLDVNTRS